MSIYTETIGHGQDLTLIHGWGMSGNIWESVADKLSGQFRVTLLDLPGYGRSSHHILDDYTLNALADAIVHFMPRHSMVLGWSLGGMIAMQMALRHPEAIKKLILVAASPQFHISEDWPHAVNLNILENFANELSNSYRDTILQFLSIQALGSEHAREEIRLLRDKVFRDGDPDEESVRRGLKILQTANLREQVEYIDIPTLIISGDRDRLMPLPAAKELSQRISKSRLCVIKGASHAPFISHQSTFLDVLQAFLAK